MRRAGAMAVFSLIFLSTSAAGGQEWAEKMFSGRSHDFGSVAKAAKSEHQFVVKNLYREEVHFSGVRASCGCTSPRIVKETLRSGEEGAIIAKFNTDTFSGQRSATLTVSIDKPQYAEVRLQIRGYIRTDVVFDPGQVSFGAVDEGNPAEQKVTVAYAGRGDWKIVGVESSSPALVAEAVETSRGGGRVGYDLFVRLNEQAAAGYLQERLTLRTNDRRYRQVPLAIEGQIVSPLAASPSPLLLGSLRPGQVVTRQLVLKGREPFRVLAIRCPNVPVTFPLPVESKPVHVIPLSFQGAEREGDFASSLQIETDLGGGRSATVSVMGRVSTDLAGG